MACPHPAGRAIAPSAHSHCWVGCALREAGAPQSGSHRDPTTHTSHDLTPQRACAGSFLSWQRAPVPHAVAGWLQISARYRLTGSPAAPQGLTCPSLDPRACDGRPQVVPGPQGLPIPGHGVAAAPHTPGEEGELLGATPHRWIVLHAQVAGPGSRDGAQASDHAGHAPSPVSPLHPHIGPPPACRAQLFPHLSIPWGLNLTLAL